MKRRVWVFYDRALTYLIARIEAAITTQPEARTWVPEARPEPTRTWEDTDA